MADLELVETDSLIAELMKRYDCAFFVGMNVRPQGGEHVKAARTHGSPAMLVGMVEREKAIMLQEIIADRSEASDDD